MASSVYRVNSAGLRTAQESINKCHFLHINFHGWCAALGALGPRPGPRFSRTLWIPLASGASERQSKLNHATFKRDNKAQIFTTSRSFEEKFKFSYWKEKSGGNKTTSQADSPKVSVTEINNQLSFLNNINIHFCSLGYISDCCC